MVHFYCPDALQDLCKSVLAESSILYQYRATSLISITQAYASSKAALSQLVRAMAREWATKNILVNAIGPALTETKLTREYFSDQHFRQNAIDTIPMQRLGLPSDLFGPIIMLMSKAGAFITGQTIYVNGGRTTV